MIAARIVIWLLALVGGMGSGPSDVGVVQGGVPLTSSVTGIVSSVAGTTLSIIDPSLRSPVIVESFDRSRIFVWHDGHRFVGDVSSVKPGARLSGVVADGALISADVEGVSSGCSAARGVVRGASIELSEGHNVSFRDTSHTYTRGVDRLPVDIADIDGEAVVVSVCDGFARVAYQSS